MLKKTFAMQEHGPYHFTNQELLDLIKSIAFIHYTRNSSKKTLRKETLISMLLNHTGKIFDERLSPDWAKFVFLLQVLQIASGKSDKRFILTEDDSGNYYYIGNQFLMLKNGKPSEPDSENWHQLDFNPLSTSLTEEVPTRIRNNYGVILIKDNLLDLHRAAANKDTVKEQYYNQRKDSKEQETYLNEQLGKLDNDDFELIWQIIHDKWPKLITELLGSREKAEPDLFSRLGL